MPPNLENPFSKPLPRETDPAADIELAGALLGPEAAEAMRELRSKKKPGPKPDDFADLDPDLALTEEEQELVRPKFFEIGDKKFEITRLEIGGKTPEEYEAELLKEDVRFFDAEKDLLAKMPVSKERHEIDTVLLTVADLGFTKPTRYDEICRRAKELGLELSPAEVGPELRLAMKDQPMDDYITVAMEAIADHHGDPTIFSVVRNGFGSGLHHDYGGPDYRWHLDFSFAFVTRKH